MEKQTLTEIPNRLDFQQLPTFARFILDDHLADFTSRQLTVSREIELPLLKFFENMPEAALMDQAMQSAGEFLTLLAANRAQDHIVESRRRWLTGQIPLIGRDQVTAEDLTLATYVQRKALAGYIPLYTADLGEALELMGELDRYFLEADTINVDTYIGLLKDRTREAERELQHSKELLLEAQELAGLGSFVWNMADSKGEFTPQVVRILDLREGGMDELMGRIHPLDRPRVEQALQAAVDGDGRYESEYRLRSSDGREKTIWARGLITRVDGKPVMRGTVMDITERQRLFQQLERSEELLKQAQALARIGSWTLDLKTRMVQWSDELFRIYGLVPGADRELPIGVSRQFYHPEDRERVEIFFRQIVEEHRPVEVHYRVIVHDEIKMLHARAEPLLDEYGRPDQMFGTVQDVTAAKRAELEILAKSEELEATNQDLQKFAFVASHDLREPLRKIVLFGSMLERDYRALLGERGRMYLDKITDASHRMEKLITDILDFSSLRYDRTSFEPTNLNRTLQAVLSDIEVSIKTTGARVDVGALPELEANPTQMRQLFQNLISNALKFSRPGTAPRVKIYAETFDTMADAAGLSGSPAYHLARLSQTGHGSGLQACRICVEDQGIGFDEAYLDKIFELFQQLHAKTDFGGTGLGLAICKRIVENHQGHITAQSRPGEGATFVLTFPLSQPR